MEEFLKKSLVQKYKYTIVIVVAYYVLPIFVYLLPVKHPSDSMIYALYLWCIIIPLVIFISSIIFAIYNGLQWYFSLRVAVLWLLYMVVFGAQSLAFAGVYFVISLVGQCIGAWFKDKKIAL
jgi:hypothetical protein